MKYGLIGEHLGHSFSKIIHNVCGDYEYELKELSFLEFEQFMKELPFKGINVTIPYKEKVIPYLDYIDDSAKKIGAVNTIKNVNGKLYGYNTDYLGLKGLVDKLEVSLENKFVLILGSGGTSKTAYRLCLDKKARCVKKASLEVLDDCEITYEQVNDYLDQIDIIINTTPCGMYPNNDFELIDLDLFSKVEAVIDVIYNPLRTKLVQKALSKGIKAGGGLYMLVSQAIYSSEIFLEKKYEDELINKIYNGILKTKENIVLIGMPSSGKSTIGKLLANSLSREFIDTDEEIEKRIHCSIKEFIERFGEAEFRKIEREVVRDVSKQSQVVISTGGGVIKNFENIKDLKQNGKIYFLNRSLNNLITSSSRPLSSNKEQLELLFKERFDLYKSYCDVIIDGDKTISEIINEIGK